MAKKAATTSVEDSPDVKLSTGERTHKAKLRFKNPKDLWDRYNDTQSKTKGKAKHRKKLIEMFERFPYRREKGGKIITEPNWGRFTDAINEYIKFFCSIALDRETWCRVETYEGLENQMSITWSDQITEAFHKYCIKPWHNKEQEIISCISDDCFFNKGAMQWKTPYDTYPVYIESEKVYPDTNATTDVRSFDLLFIKDSISAVDLFDHATSPISKDLGWNSKSILRALASRSDSDNLKQKEDVDSVTERWRRGDVPQADQDRLIPIVWCYVKEYKPADKNADPEKKGNRISVMVIPQNLIALGVDTSNEKELKNSSENLRRKDYFYFVDYYAEDFPQVISLWTSNIKRGFYNNSSFAAQIYLGCRFYDQTMNTMIRAVKRSMRLWMKTGNADTKKRIQQMDADDEVGLLNQDDDIQQIGIKQDVTAATELMRTVSASINQFSPSEFQGTQNSPKGYPITKGEAQILNQQLDDSKSMSIKLFISKNREFICELYRRFVNSTAESDTWKNFQRFKKVMNLLGIPKEAWSYENVEIFPRFNQFAGKASANYAAAKALLEATQIKPASVPEQRAKRNIISSLSGGSDVSEYQEQPMQIDNEIFIIGQENEALDNPFSGAQNIPVTQSDNHMLHIQGHMSDYITKLTIANQLLKTAATDQTYKRQFFIEYAANLINSQDNKGAHIEAHFAIMVKDDTKQDEVKILADQFAEAQKQQDVAAQKIKELQDQENTSNSRKQLMDLEFEHDKRMKDQAFQFAQAMDNIKLEKATNQTIIGQEKTKQKHDLDIAAKQEDQALKVEDKKIDLTTKAEEQRLKIAGLQTKQSMEEIKAQKKAAEPTKELAPA